MPLEIKYLDCPHVETRWGMLPADEEDKVKLWLANCTNELIRAIDMSRQLDYETYSSTLNNFVRMVYDEIHQIGYNEGYDSAQCDNEGEGL